MIGRQGDIDTFAAVKWVRQVAHREHRDTDNGEWRRLKPLEVLVLMDLAIYAGRDGIAFPSIQTLTLNAGLTPKKNGQHAQVSRALRSLMDMKLIWSKGGRSRHREILFDPAQPLQGREPLIPSTGDRIGSPVEGTELPPNVQPAAPPSAVVLPKRNGQGFDSPDGGIKHRPPTNELEARARIRAQITESMQTARAAA